MIFNILELKNTSTSELKKTLIDNVIRLDKPDFLECFLNITKSSILLTNCWSLVHECCYVGSINCLKYLKDNNYNLNESYTNSNCDFFNVKPIQLAIYNGHLDLVRYLLSSINIEFNERVTVMGANCTMLMAAIFNEHLDIIGEIIDKSDVNIQNDQGDTALHFAALRLNYFVFFT